VELSFRIKPLPKLSGYELPAISWHNVSKKVYKTTTNRQMTIVQQLREEKNLTQTELAEKVDFRCDTKGIEAGNIPKGFHFKISLPNF
jgi:hypothetical protein